MKNLAYLLFVGLLAFATAGYFLNWYQFNDTKNTNGHRRLTLDLDANKIEQDIQKGEANLSQAIETHIQQGQSNNQPSSNSNQKQLTPPQLQPPSP